MRFLIASIGVFLLTVGSIVYFNSRHNYFGSEFETSNLWLSTNNPNLASVSSYEEFTKVGELYDFYSDGVRFARIQFTDSNNDFNSIDIPEDIVGKSIYSVSSTNGIPQQKLLNRAESIKAISEWRTDYTFKVFRDVNTNSYKVISLSINEPN